MNVLIKFCLNFMKENQHSLIVQKNIPFLEYILDTKNNNLISLEEKYEIMSKTNIYSL